MKNIKYDYDEAFAICENSKFGHLVSGVIYPTSVTPTQVGFCLQCGNILETYDGVHYLWIHRLSGNVIVHFEMRF